MRSFKEQILEDINGYKEEYQGIKNINKDEWAFNFWILDKLFFEEPSLIEEKIIDYHDMGIDAYEIFEDMKEVYLIQNKFYDENTLLSADYVKNDFLIRGKTALENGTFTKSKELQSFFNKYKNSNDFHVYLWLFVTNDRRVAEADKYVKEFNRRDSKYSAKIFYLEDIKNKYFGEVKENKKNISITIETICRGTLLNVNCNAYKLPNVVDARYVLVPVVNVYRFYRNCLEQGYPIFDKNIREYLGNKGINKNIYNTLLNENERENFFYYNNGITIICDKMSAYKNRQSDNNFNLTFNIDNPQIANGCQTVNSIYEALDNSDVTTLENDYKDSFVMLKILEINRNDSAKVELYEKIVKYNNSQNAIDEKTFVSNSSEFKRLQTEFEKNGFLLLIKQSDKNSFKVKYGKKLSILKEKNNIRLTKFGLPELRRVEDVFIPLDKLMQIINAFVSGGLTAYKNKKNMLKFGTKEYNDALDFIKSVLHEDLIELYLLFLRSEAEKKKDKFRRYPTPYYLIDLFGLYECNNRDKELIRSELENKTKINRIIRIYTEVTKRYANSYRKKYKEEYNTMIKKKIDYDIFNEERELTIENL